MGVLTVKHTHTVNHLFAPGRSCNTRRERVEVLFEKENLSLVLARGRETYGGWKKTSFLVKS